MQGQKLLVGTGGTRYSYDLFHHRSILPRCNLPMTRIGDGEGTKNLVVTEIAKMIGDELDEVFRETREVGWDGFGGFPTSEKSLALVKSFLAALGATAIIPSAGAEPDGSFTLEWYAGRGRSLSLSFSRAAVVHFAILDGNFRDCGTAAFNGTVPNCIMDHIQRICCSIAAVPES